MSESHRRYFNATAEKWLHRPESPELLDYLLQFNVMAGDRVLDAGAGTGRMTRFLLPLVGRTGQVIALDAAEMMLRIGRFSAQAKSAVTLCADLCALPLLSESFDKAVCLAVLPHCRPLQSALREVFRVLKPGGKVLILHTCGSEELNAIHARLPKPICDDVLPPVSSLSRELIEIGFVDIQAEENSALYRLQAQRPPR
ncbi:MAG TPA: class I SAM-dependent methyltransferase [bacterium]|nr:class I SAM-dependent methyltransferase [bacterium]HNT66868.1 class I SAM-dependent methyltransferase [bacterium]